MSDQEFSFTRETVAMHLGEGALFQISDDNDPKFRGVHVGAVGVTMIEYDVTDPFDAMRATTAAWRSLHSIALDTSGAEVVHVGIQGIGVKWVFAMPRENIEAARSMYSRLMHTMANV